MESKPPALSPDEQLAEMIVAKLVEAGCIRESDARNVQVSIALGKATADDWTYWIENALESPESEVSHGAS